MMSESSMFATTPQRLSLSLYIYIYREREMCVCVCVYVCAVGQESYI